LVNGAPFGLDAVMCKEVTQMYAIRLDDLKPIRWQERAEICESDDLVYLVGGALDVVIIADVLVREGPKDTQRTEGGQRGA
jgi:hypothetical protein